MGSGAWGGGDPRRSRGPAPRGRDLKYESEHLSRKEGMHQGSGGGHEVVEVVEVVVTRAGGRGERRERRETTEGGTSLHLHTTQVTLSNLANTHTSGPHPSHSPTMTEAATDMGGGPPAT